MKRRAVIALGMLSWMLLAGCAATSISPVSVTPGEASLIAEGGTPRMTIVVGVASPASTRYAAEELQRFLSQMTGADMPLVTDDTPAGPAEILVGESRRLQGRF